MQQIQSNIQSAISSISLPCYQFQNQIKNGVINTVQQRINGCIPSYMSNCFSLNSSVSNYGSTSATINTTMSYINGQNQTTT
ncbi:hypothetical protein J6P68_05510 [bacterium]|nr:hypothetical protein [bacterium]